jgi:hypothetical protein
VGGCAVGAVSLFILFYGIRVLGVGFFWRVGAAGWTRDTARRVRVFMLMHTWRAKDTVGVWGGVPGPCARRADAVPIRWAVRGSGRCAHRRRVASPLLFSQQSQSNIILTKNSSLKRDPKPNSSSSATTPISPRSKYSARSSGWTRFSWGNSPGGGWERWWRVRML